MGDDSSDDDLKISVLDGAALSELICAVDGTNWLPSGYTWIVRAGAHGRPLAVQSQHAKTFIVPGARAALAACRGLAELHFEVTSAPLPDVLVQAQREATR